MNKTAFVRPPANLQIKFAIGEILHMLMQSEVNEISKTEDGIVFTMDEVGMEFKTSRMSRNKLAALHLAAKSGEALDMDKLDQLGAPTHWIRQMMAYAHVWKRNTFYLVALFINGNYNSKKEPAVPSGYEPVLDAFEITFTDAELEENWNWYSKRGKLLASALKLKKMPPVTTRAYSWECSLCPYFSEFCAEELVTRGMATERDD